MEGKKTATLIIPVRNEEENISPLLERIFRAVSPLTFVDCSVLFVNDGSTDNTEKVIEQFSGNAMPVGYITLSRNFGHQAALEAGLFHATGDILITMDGDLEHPPEMIPAMIEEHLKGADIVQMQRANTGRDFKGVLSMSFYSFFKKISQTQVVSNAADFRLMSRKAVEEIKKMQGKGKLLRAIIPAIGFCQATLPYIQPRRKFGKPKYTYFVSYELAMHTLFKHSSFPANALLFSGIFSTSATFITLLLSALGVFPLPGTTLNLSLTCLLGGLILFCAGILSWYLHFILEQVRRDPTYIVSKSCPPKKQTE